MKKLLFIFLFVLCLAGILTGCADKSSTPDDDPSQSEESSPVGNQNNILFIEAEDPLHLDFGAFKVGDKFTTYEKTEDGGEVGVTVRVHQNDIAAPYIAYFTCAEEMQSLTVDSSACKLDKNGCFTEEGVFTVRLEYKGFETTYNIRVENGNEE